MQTEQLHDAPIPTPEPKAHQASPPVQQPQSRPLSPWTHFAIITGVLTPVALLPYLAVRGQLAALQRAVHEVSQTGAALQRELKAALLETAIRREEHDRLAGALADARREFEAFRAEHRARELQRARAEERTRAQIEELAAQNARTRTNLATLRDLSPTLADIAAFMHEVELQQGFATHKNDGRGIEKIRQFAYKLGSMLTSDAEADNPPQTDTASSTTTTAPSSRSNKKEKKAKQAPENFDETI